MTDLLALAPQNDPFYTGAPAQVAAAEWFATWLERLPVPVVFHLRRFHYVIVSAGDVPKPDGTPYENTDRDWTFLLNASRFARYKHLVDPRRFADHRSPDPIFGFPDAPTAAAFEPSAYLAPDWLMRTLRLVRPVDPGFGEAGPLVLPPPSVEGYDADDADQPYLVTLFIEKTTQNDILIPLAQELALDLYPGAGFQSITAVVRVLTKAAETRKPVRAFFISDFDPAGAGMPVATARQFEFWTPHLAPGIDVALHHLALTREQADRYRLPRIPIKESDRRRATFEERNGEGAVELDALEALRPGELERLVRRAVRPYRDFTHLRRLEQAETEAGDLVRAAWEMHVAPHAEEVEQLRDQLSSVSRSIVDRLTQIEEDLVETWEPPALPPRPTAEADGSDESGWLYHSGRDYLEQLAAYRQRREVA